MPWDGVCRSLQEQARQGRHLPPRAHLRPQAENRVLTRDITRPVIARHAPLSYRLAQAILYGLLRLLTRLDVEGREHIPSDRRAHRNPQPHSLLDSVVTFALVPRRITVFAADKWRHTPYGCLLKGIGNAIYVARGEADRGALNQAIKTLRAGGMLGSPPKAHAAAPADCRKVRMGLPTWPAGQVRSCYLWPSGARKKRSAPCYEATVRSSMYGSRLRSNCRKKQITHGVPPWPPTPTRSC